MICTWKIKGTKNTNTPAIVINERGHKLEEW